MKISHLLETGAGTTSSGSVAPVSQVLSTTQKRTNPSIYKNDKVGSLFKGKQTDKPFANSISEGIEQSVAEGFPHDVDHMPGKTIRHQDTNCTTCHGRKSMYKLGSKLVADNKQGAEKVKCPTCKGTGDKQGVAEGFDDTNKEIARKLLPRLKQQSGGSTVEKCAALAAQYFNSAGLQSSMDIDEYIKQEMAKQGVAEAEKNPHTSALGKALYRDLSKEKKASPAQVEKNKVNWAKNPHNPANKEQGVAEDTEGQKPTTWYKDNKPFSLTRDGSNFHLVDQSGNIVRNLRIPPRYIPMNLEDEGYSMSNTGREYYKNPKWFTLDEACEDELDEKAVSKQQQKFFGMAHAIQKGEKVKGASPELKKVAKTMGKQDVKDFASTKHKGLPKKVSEVAPASDLDVTVDPELKKTIGFAQAHYPASKNSSDAFHKFVQRSIKHGKEDDNRQDTELAKIENEILSLKSKLAGIKSIPATVEESEINEEDLILVPGMGHRMKPGLLHKAEVSINPTDTIKVDIPLLIKLLEYARENASGDLDLHDLAEKLVILGDRGRTLTMRDYERVVDVPEEQVDEVSNELAKSYLHGAMRDTITNKKDRNPGMKRAIARLSGTNKPLLNPVPTVAESKSAIMSGLTK